MRHLIHPIRAVVNLLSEDSSEHEVNIVNTCNSTVQHYYTNMTDSTYQLFLLGGT